MAILAITLVACGPSKEEIAKNEAKQEATKAALVIANGTISGDSAEAQRSHIYDVLRAVDLVLADVPLEASTLDYQVREAHGRDAAYTFRTFWSTKAAPEQAQELKAKFILQAKQAGKTFEDFRTSSQEMSQVIARNSVEIMQANGGKPTVAMLRAAGMTVPTIVKTRTIIKRVPAKPIHRVAHRAPVKKHRTKLAERRSGG